MIQVAFYPCASLFAGTDILYKMRAFIFTNLIVILPCRHDAVASYDSTIPPYPERLAMQCTFPHTSSYTSSSQKPPPPMRKSIMIYYPFFKVYQNSAHSPPPSEYAPNTASTPYSNSPCTSPCSGSSTSFPTTPSRSRVWGCSARSSVR